MASEHERDDFEQLFEETAKMIYNLGLRLFKDQEDALDFSQDVYLRAYDRRGTFEGRARFSTWLYSLALNLGLKKLKKEKRVRIDPREHEDLERYAGEQSLGDDDPYHQVADAEINAHVREELNDLPDAYRVPLILHYFEELPYAEIAESLGLKEGTLKSYIHRGKRMLSARLRERGLQAN